MVTYLPNGNKHSLAEQPTVARGSAVLFSRRLPAWEPACRNRRVMRSIPAPAGLERRERSPEAAPAPSAAGRWRQPEAYIRFQTIPRGRSDREISASQSRTICAGTASAAATSSVVRYRRRRSVVMRLPRYGADICIRLPLLMLRLGAGRTVKSLHDTAMISNWLRICNPNKHIIGKNLLHFWKF